jgi:pimeloyl-ACP methyl ester carboxylesterase
MQPPTHYRTIQIDGLSIFYREAGAKDAPAILLLHGLPSSSRMFEPPFAAEADGQAVPHTAALRGIERFEEHVRSLRLETHARIPCTVRLECP